MKIIVDSSRCQGSGECLKACPHGAITLENRRAVVNHSLCDLDGLCLPACPHEAIGLTEEA